MKFKKKRPAPQPDELTALNLELKRLMTLITLAPDSMSVEEMRGILEQRRALKCAI